MFGQPKYYSCSEYGAAVYSQSGFVESHFSAFFDQTIGPHSETERCQTDKVLLASYKVDCFFGNLVDDGVYKIELCSETVEYFERNFEILICIHELCAQSYYRESILVHFVS